MKTIIQRSWKGIISGMIPLVLLAFIISISIQSCQKEEIMRAKEEAVLKSATIPEINEHYHHMEEVCEDFDISFSSTCGKIMIERGYINGDPIMDDDIIIGYEKVYTGLTCDTQGLLWQSIDNDEFLPCTGGTITENWAEAGTYVYRVKLNYKAFNNSDCPDCATFKGNKFDCFMITVVEGNSGTFTDTRDDNTYNWVKIGDQIWMAENLAWLPSVSSPETGSNIETYYYVYGYSGTEASAAKANVNYSTYGVLYNWPAALTACPTGWHLPSDADWTELSAYLGGQSVAGGKMKETGTTHWYDPNTGATNESGFSALPGGVRYYNGYFDGIGYGGVLWSSMEHSAPYAWQRGLYYLNSYVIRGWGTKGYGFSVRCVMD